MRSVRAGPATSLSGDAGLGESSRMINDRALLFRYIKRERRLETHRAGIGPVVRRLLLA